VIVVAGGTGGLGRAVSLAFLKEDAHVVVTYRKQEEFDALKNLAGGNGSQLEGYRVDIADETEVEKLIEAHSVDLGSCGIAPAERG
jgi:NAD(P)-dependent dehydrogenase (short-subunit alcohol dehydrogenase family)